VDWLSQILQIQNSFDSLRHEIELIPHRIEHRLLDLGVCSRFIFNGEVQASNSSLCIIETRVSS
jgi:hypothetical protein